MDNIYNISGRLQMALEKAIYLSEDLQTGKLMTFEVALALLMDDESAIQQQFQEEGEYIDTSGIIYGVSVTKELYEKVTGLEFPTGSDEVGTQEDANEAKSADDNDQENEIESDEQKDSSQKCYVVVNPIYVEEMYDYDNIQYSDELSRAFEDAWARCSSAGKDFIDENNLLYSMLMDKESSVVKLFNECVVSVEQLCDMLRYNCDIYEKASNNQLKIPASLETCCEVLNNKYQKGEKCEILERDKEIFLLWNIFSKKTKRNAVLVGDAGVGKTAIVEAITMQIVNEKCPKEFKGYNVISLNLNSMVAGTKYRGEFEKKVQSFIKFLKNSSKIIVFVDEIHQILGAGGAEGSGPDLSGSLKPILARDDVIFVGATTKTEYNRYFTTDPAFKRRFERVDVEEPKLSQVKKMIEIKVKNISNYHKVSISEDLLDYIIITAKAMNCEANNPDLTVDLIDKAMAIAKMRKSKELTRKDVDKVYMQNYEKYRRISKKDRLSTAYHEAGHALLRLISKKSLREEVKIVSIIPADDYLGVTISEENDRCKPITREAVLETASISLAGRVAQEFVNKEWDFGASSDLVQATKIIKKMIVEMGMDTNIYTNISLYDYSTDGLNMSPEAVDMVNSRVKEIMQDVYENTKVLLTKHKDKLDIIANLLMKRGIISIDEIMEAFEKHGVKL